jgi:hypothetical protein
VAEIHNPQRRLYPAMAMVYAHLLPRLQSVAREHGYALAVHGSMATDFDLLACPWTEYAVDAYVLIEALCGAVGGILAERDWDTNPSLRAHGRLAWSIYFDAQSAKDCSGPYLDISVMPKDLKPAKDTPIC